MKYLGIDYGTKRTGLAISDDEGRVAVLKETIEADSQDDVVTRIREVVDADQVEVIIIGLPVNMENEPTEMTDLVERFIAKLRDHVEIPVQTVDERLTTEMAKQLLRGVKKEERDQVAAQILLQNFLDKAAEKINYMSLGVLITTGVTFAAAVFGSALIRKLAQRWKVLDIPGAERKIHQQPTPLLGGVAVILAFIIGVALAWPQLVGGYLLPKHLLGVIAGAAVILAGGALDDKFDLSPKLQILFPVLASAIIISSGIGIDYITNPLGGVLDLDTVKFQLFSFAGLPYHFTLFADLFTIAWLMGMMYTTKFLDGLDGLVSGVTVIGAIIIAILSLTSVVFQPETAHLALLAGTAFFGFLLLNWHPAKIFLGESGALFAGFILGVLGIISGGKIATTLLVLGIPILDVVWVIVRRLFIEKRSPFVGDRKHLHMRLLDIGLSHRQTALFLYALTAVFGASSLFLQSRSKIVALIVMSVTMIVLGVIVVRQYRKKNVQSR